ncbi:MAG: ACP S-malonyltransferase [Bacteroides sp.]|nr:ACP S-malonyltransferase [Bacteroides sp.]MDR3823244.1 ACP S-malonyltransferase [Bacteroides sp.]
MGKRVFMFPGQGSQYIGMGKEFYDTMPNAKAVIDLASEQTGLDIPALCFEENDKLNITEYTQICMLAVEAAIYQAIIDKGITPDVTAGLSLGEYGALIASGAMTMADAFAVVRKRGIYMQEAVPTGGAMTAVLGLDPQVIEDICKKTADETNSVVSVANYNCPGQIVISGSIEGINKACELMKAAGAKRALPLKVGGAFHSPLMNPAKVELEAAINATEIHAPKCPVYQNVDAMPHTDPVEIKKNLVAQLTASVRWTQTVKNMVADGATDFTECGPGAVLQGLIKKIAPEATAHGIA